jgi:hypothetical protein
MESILLPLLIVVVLIGVIAVAARLMPSGSGGAPGEVVADEPLSTPTGASMDDTSHAGGAEDRPGGPGQASMDPDGSIDADPRGAPHGADDEPDAR